MGITLKLNNNGWGTVQMFLLSGGLLIALLVAAFFIANLYGSFNGPLGNNGYLRLEEKLENAAKEYIKSKKIEITGELTINYSLLKDSGFVDGLRDINGNDCNGYVKITPDGNVDYYNGYISCKNYQTINY